MTQYDKKYELPLIMPPESLDNILANVLAAHHLRNLRVAETEKFAHVTYFFNGGIETPFPGEDRMLIPSLKVATYDLAPEMSAEGIGDTIVKAINDTAFDLIVANFANADMVGHSGKLEPTIKACEAVDAQLGRIYKAIKEKNGSWLITADHGNAELMVDPVTGGPHTAHTTNPVPFIYVGEDAPHYRLRNDGSLRDISPTLLAILKLERAKADDRRRSARADREVTPAGCSAIGFTAVADADDFDGGPVPVLEEEPVIATTEAEASLRGFQLLDVSVARGEVAVGAVEDIEGGLAADAAQICAGVFRPEHGETLGVSFFAHRPNSRSISSCGMPSPRASEARERSSAVVFSGVRSSS